MTIVRLVFFKHDVIAVVNAVQLSVQN